MSSLGRIGGKIIGLYLFTTVLAVFCSIMSMVMTMGIDSLCGMFRCMSNCLGDVAVTAIVAKSEGVLDMKKYARMK